MMIDVFVFTVLVTLIVLRLFFINDNQPMMALCVWGGFCISLIDLYNKLETRFQGEDVFHVLRGTMIIVMVVVAIPFAVILCGGWTPSPRCEDVVTLLTVLLSLSQRFIIKIIIEIIKKRLGGTSDV